MMPCDYWSKRSGSVEAKQKGTCSASKMYCEIEMSFHLTLISRGDAA